MENPKPVNIVGAETTIPVSIVEEKKTDPVLVKREDKQSLAPVTTEQEDITKAGQRKINLIWEGTQALVALSITWAVIYMAINKAENQVLSNAFFLIVSMYFVRTNHQLIGGTGVKPIYQQR